MISRATSRQALFRELVGFVVFEEKFDLFSAFAVRLAPALVSCRVCDRLSVFKSRSTEEFLPRLGHNLFLRPPRNPDVGAPLATRVLCAGRGVWCSYRPKFEIGVVELLARKRKLAIAPGTTGTRPLGGRTEMPEFGDPSKSRTSRFRAVNTPLGYFGLYGDEDEHAQTF